VTVRAHRGRSRALRYGAGTSAVVLLVCISVAGLSIWTLGTVGSRVTGATARAHGEVIHSAGRGVEIRWSAPGGQRIDTVALAVPAPPVGTRTEIAYDPRDPAAVFIPGSTELAAVDRTLVAAEVDGTWLHPSGPVRVTEPRGQRIDSPARTASSEPTQGCSPWPPSSAYCGSSSTAAAYSPGRAPPPWPPPWPCGGPPSAAAIPADLAPSAVAATNASTA
jgi:hypothetical protein